MSELLLEYHEEKIGKLELEINRLELIAEDLECAHMWLDKKDVPRNENDVELSVIGRIMRLTK